MDNELKNDLMVAARSAANDAFLQFPYDWEVFFSSDGSLIYISPEVEAHTGYPAQCFTQQKSLLTEILHPDDRPFFRTHLAGCPENLTPSAAELCVITKPGKKIFVDYFSIPLENEKGYYLGRWARYKILADCDRLVHYDWGSVETWNSIVENLPDHIIIINKRGKIIYTNNISLDGGPPRSTLGKCVYDYIYSADRKLAYETIQQVIASGQKSQYEISSVSNGKTFWYLTRVGLVEHYDQDPMITLVIRDITARKNTEQALIQLNEVLEQRIEERTAELKRNQISLQQRARFLEHTEQINALLRRATNRVEVLQIISKLGCDTLHADISGVYVIRGDTLELAIHLGMRVAPPDNLRVDANNFIYKLIYETQQVTFLPKLNAEDKKCSFCSYLHRAGVVSLAMAPLRTTTSLVGFQYLAYSTPPDFSSGNQQILGVIAEAGGNTLHRIQVTERLEEHIANREKILAVLYEVMSITSETNPLEDILQKSLTAVLDSIPESAGIIYLNGDKREEFQIAAKFGRIGGLHGQLVHIDDLEEFQVKRPANQRGLWRATVACPPSDLVTHPGEYIVYTIPLNFGGYRNGIMSVILPINTPLSEANENLIVRVAHLLGKAVENVHLKKKAQEAIIIEERQRLARNMHDSVTQFLYGLVLSADVGVKLLGRGDISTLETNLHEIGETALQALREMRLLLFELKPLALESEGLIKALNLRLEAVEKRAGIDCEFHVQGGQYLPISLESEFYRITTEALNNAIKHAHPQQVKIFINATKHRVELEIRDNGKGFNVDEIDNAGIGLMSMRERATLMGGQLEIKSQLGLGTQVKLIVDLMGNGKGHTHE